MFNEVSYFLGHSTVLWCYVPFSVFIQVVTKAFHGAGLVVPVDKNDVGYRELPETNGKHLVYYMLLLFCSPQ